MVSDALLQRTIDLFPGWDPERVRIEPIERGGSDRSFFRLIDESGRENDPPSAILIQYGALKEENRHYVNIALFLADIGLQVPKIYLHDETEQFIWMQDLGERDLWSFRNEPWTKRRTLYRKAIEQARLLHTVGYRHFEQTSLSLQPIFDAALYRWEQDYFFENCVGRYFGKEASSLCRCGLDEIAEYLATRPRVLVHRDFQSQNIMILEGRAYLIDFQGLRPGLAQYDLASILYDPYVTLAEEERAELLEGYMQGIPSLDRADFLRVFDLCALQRLMQALGAYGFLGLVRDRPRYLSFIAPTLVSLRAVVARISGLDELLALLDSLEK